MDGEPWRDLASSLLKNEDLGGEYASLEAWLSVWKTWEERKIKTVAYEYLSRRSYFSLDIKNKLQQLGFCPNLIDSVLCDLQRQGYLDDQRQTEAFIGHSIRKKKGPHWVAYQLKQKGLSFTEEAYPRQAREDTIREILNKKGKKGIVFLIRKGFLYEEIISVYNSLNML